MKAIIRTKYGSPDVLELKEIDKPVPKENQVLLKIHAAAVNPLDWHVLRGKPFLIRLMGIGILKPKVNILGADFAGRIEEIGSNVKQFKVGDDVLGSSMGGFAEYGCFSETALALKPAAMTFEQAASLPVAGLTALQGLRIGNIQSGKRVLINGASGGVGTFAIQIAKSFGAEVTGVCSTRNLELVRSLGAEHTIDYTKEDFTKNGQQFDLILDNAASHSLFACNRALNRGGSYVMVGGSSMALYFQTLLLGPLVSMFNSNKNQFLMAKTKQKDLVLLGELFETGKFVPVIDKTYSLDEVPDAIRYIEQGHARGKVIIAVC